MHIGVFGAGAVGGYVGGHLVREGCDVTLIGQWPEHVERVRRDGLRLRSTDDGEIVVRPRILHLTDVQSLSKRPLDAVFLCVKSYDTDWATAMIAQYLKPDGYVASLQNGINEERIAARVGWDRTIGVVLNTIGVNGMEPGTAVRTSRSGGVNYVVFRVGEPDGRMSPRAQELARLLSVVDAAAVTTNLWGERWSKLLANSVSHGLSTVSGVQSRAVLLTSPELQPVTIALVAEGVRVGEALGYALVDIYSIAPGRWAAAHAGDAGAKAEVVKQLDARRGRLTDAERPSAIQDRLRGRRTELDYTNGLVVERAQSLGIPAPVQACIYAGAREVEAGTREASVVTACGCLRP